MNIVRLSASAEILPQDARRRQRYPVTWGQEDEDMETTVAPTVVERLLKEHDWTVAWLARQVAIADSALRYQLEHRSQPNYRLAVRVAEVLCVYPTAIIDEDGRWREANRQP